ncbi:MAG: NUDIX hydrolase [Clostridia bacterium]|nr:NUDIX hydrolase [Clostridia bacterium]
MEDITVDVKDWRLNCRAAAIIIHNNKVLLHRNTKDTYYALLGGRVKFGENSADAVKREIKEELGKDIEITGYISTIENFFELKNKKYHEIMFIHKAEFINDDDKKIETTLKNIEGNKEKQIQYEWISLEDLDDKIIMPQVIKQVLKDNIFPVHKINNDFNPTNLIC